MIKQRVNPEQFLRHAKKEERDERQGKLKIYLGAAPGVGKTYEMLHDALQKHLEGLDVVIGIVESHGRQDIEAMIKDFEVLPRKAIKYHGTTCLELDLDTVYQRHPGLILIDEMAHTNVPGSRHAKRWQDINELLEHGIDIYTTLNVQHIESLRDDIAQIIQAPIKETVPDSMIEKANTIELIDLPPEELLKRLREGKVYFPAQATLAREHFFRKGNLIALRELALCVTAERVGTDVLWYRQGEGIKQIWHVKDKILVCVGPPPESLRLIRGAKRIANSLQAEWLAIYVDTPRLQLRIQERNQAISNLQLAKLLGAETHVIAGVDIINTIIGFAREQNVTQIMIWKNVTTRWRDWFRHNLADEILRHSGEIDVYIMTGERKPATITYSSYFASWRIYLLSPVIVMVASAINALLYPMIDVGSVIMLYLLGIIGTATFGYLGPAIFTAILSILAYDFFFVQPFYSLNIGQSSSIITLLMMLLVAHVISRLTILTRLQAKLYNVTQHKMESLYTLSRKLIITRGLNNLVAFGTKYIADIFKSEVTILMPKKGFLQIVSGSQTKYKLNAKEYGIAQWVYNMAEPAGFGTDNLSSPALYLPLSAKSGTIGVLRIKSCNHQLFTPEERALLEGCVNQIALAIEVDSLHTKSLQKELATETDEARLILLQSVLQDLSAPLKNIANTVKDVTQTDLPGNISNQKMQDLKFSIATLSKLYDNLLQIIQLETVPIALHCKSSSITRIIANTLKEITKHFPERIINTTLSDKLPTINVDPKLIQKVFFHLLDNAIKFSPAQFPIQIVVYLEANKMIISVEDHGDGVLPQEKKKLFRAFYRGKRAEPVRGLGLGLAICQKIILAHKGSIWVENIQDKGAAFRFALPLRAEQH